jgi:hypothetical protein
VAKKGEVEFLLLTWERQNSKQAEEMSVPRAHHTSEKKKNQIEPVN